MPTIRQLGGHLGRWMLRQAVALHRALTPWKRAGASGRVLVFSPSGFASGGPEALHQLVDELNRQGFDAHICYTPAPFTPKPSAYAGYNAKPAFPVDNPGDLIIVPEAETGIVRWFRRAHVAVWWLSVDFFYGAYKDDRWFADQIATDERGDLNLPRQASWEDLRRVSHLSLSNYSTEFLKRRGISSTFVGDYIHPSYTDEVPDRGQVRSNTILYNPAKSRAVVERLKARFPEFSWRELRGMSRTELQQVLRSSKLFVDFGNHPGRDRIPREAVASGTCMILGLRGTVAVPGDVPIPDRYKLEPSAPDFEARFAALARSILASYDDHSKDFEAFAAAVRQQRADFRREVSEVGRLVGRPGRA